MRVCGRVVVENQVGREVKDTLVELALTSMADTRSASGILLLEEKMVCAIAWLQVVLCSSGHLAALDTATAGPQRENGTNQEYISAW